MPIHREESRAGTLTVETITIDHPSANVLDLEHVEELSSVLHQVRADDRARIVILRGAGDVFSTGVDIREHSPELMPRLLPAFHALFEDLLGLSAVTIAAVHGRCLGGAAELAFGCDRVIAEVDTEVGLPEIGLGCYPPAAIPQLLARVGIGRATGMILGGGNVAVETLAGWGLVDIVAAAGGIDESLDAELARYATWSPAVVGQVAQLLHEETRRMWADRVPRIESEYLEHLLPHPDCAEGIAAFNEKREPVWRAPDGLMTADDVAL